MPSGVSPELIEQRAPVTRRHARISGMIGSRMAGSCLRHEPSSGTEVAEKMIGRIISDSIR